MPDRTYWTESQIELTEKARDAAQLAARRAQEAAGLTSGVVEQVQLINAEVAGRQQDIEAAIGANVPDHEWDNGSIRFRNPDGEWGDLTNVRGVAGYAGWAPLLVMETDGERRVLKIESWIGGEGPAPAAGLYIGAAGLVPTAAEAVDVRGAQGETGDIGPPISLVEGTITTGDPGDPADITLTETTPGVWTVDMTIPQGIPGEDGEDADTPLAANVSFDNSGTELAAETVQAALAELDDEKAPASVLGLHFRGMQGFTSSGTFTPPAGVDRVFVIVQGGGQGGRQDNVSNLRCGNGGDCVMGFIDVTGSVSVTIGAGSAGASVSNPSAGGDTSVGALAVAKGGSSATTSSLSGGIVLPGQAPDTGIASLGGASGFGSFRGSGGSASTSVNTAGQAGFVIVMW